MSGYDEACVFRGECPFREWSNVLELEIPAPPPPPPPPARYTADVRSTHPSAIRDGSRNWTYLGDTVRVTFRNATTRPATRQPYRVCYTRNARLACQTRTLTGPSLDVWRLRILPPWAGRVRGRYTRYVEFTWRASGRLVAKRRIWVFE